MMRLLCFVSVSLLWPTCGQAGSGNANVTSPRLGYVFEAGSRVLRGVDGIPGAALAGPAVDIGFPIAGAVVSPDQSYVLAIRAEARSAHVVTFSGNSAATREIPGIQPRIDSLALSPSGRSAVLYSAVEGVMQVVRGLPEAPVADRAVRVAGAARLAVSDDAKLVLVSTADDLSPVLIFSEGELGRAMPVLGPVSAMAFRPQTHDALIAGAGGVTLVREPGAGSQYQVFAESQAACVALSFSRQGDRFIAAYDDGAIVTYDLGGREASRLDCECVPRLLQPMGPDSVFRLTEGDGEPMRLLDLANHRVVFVPASRP